jgi:hypothetical protein
LVGLYEDVKPSLNKYGVPNLTEILIDVGTLNKKRHNFSVSVYKNYAFIIGGNTTQGDFLRTIEAIEVDSG